MPTPWDYESVECDGEMSTNRSEGRMGKAGEYQAQEWTGAPASPPVPENSFPNIFNYGHDPGNSQFSSDKENDPIKLLESRRAEVMKHSDMNQAFGLNQPVATIGSHPFLRDELSNPSEAEPANAEPFPTVKLPKRG
jgi:hypothetical protein